MFTFYSLESPTEEEEGNLNERLLTTHSCTFLGFKKLCFICNGQRKSDSNAYNCGGLARSCEVGARCKLFDIMNIFSQDLARKFHEAAIRLFMKIGYEAHDSFAADIYYHNSC